jgi:molybdate transport system substrate-binding protein
VRRALAATAAVLAAGLLAGCAEPAGSAPSPSARTASDAGLAGSITVDAAASLNRVLPTLARSFEAAHPGTSIRFSFGGSSDLAAAIAAGAPVDVFAAASAKTMATVTAAHLAAATPVAIARNRLEIAVPKGDPGHVTALRDFADPGRTIVVCAPAVPCGAAAQQVFALAHVTPKPDSLEQSVTGVLTKVRLGEADAGLVYVTDVQAAGSAVQGIRFPEADRAVTDVLLAPLAHAPNPALARAFTTYVERHGRPVLTAAGFLAPAS